MGVILVIVWAFYSGKLIYLTEPKYCLVDSDCVMNSENCEAVNKYHYNVGSERMCAWEEQPVPCCREYQCTLHCKW